MGASRYAVRIADEVVLMGRRATGSMREIRPGHWELRIPIANDGATRKRRQLSRVYVGDRDGARRTLDALLVQHGGRELLEASDSVDGLFADWIKAPSSKTSTARSATSVYQETRRYERHVKPAIGALAPRRVRTVDLNRLYQSLLRSGLSPRSVQRVHQLVRAMYQWALEQGYVDVNPAQGATAPKPPPPTPRPPSFDVVESLLDAAAEADPELLLMVRLGAVTAARRSELVGLRWSHIDFDRGTVSIEAGEVVVPTAVRGAPRRVTTDTKTGEGAVLSLDAETIDLLTEHGQRQVAAADAVGTTYPDDGYVFASNIAGTQAWHPDTMSARMERLRDSVPGAKGVTLKSLRAFVASELHADGADITTAQAVLRHRSSSTTLRHYKAAKEASVRSATKGLGERLGRKRD